MKSLATLIAVVSILGGLIGFIKSKSIASLSGLLFGLLYFSDNETILFWNSIVLMIVMGMKAKSGKPVPVVMTFLGLLGSIVYSGYL